MHLWGWALKMVYFVLAAWLLVILVRVFRPPVPSRDDDGVVVSDNTVKSFERWRTTFWPMIFAAVLVTLAWPLVTVVTL